MDSTLKDIFEDSLKREGQSISIDGTSYRVFFRRNNKGTVDPYVTMFAPVGSLIPQGAEFTLNGDSFLILNQNTDENAVYQKYSCVKCNEGVTFMLRYASDTTKAERHAFQMFMSDSFGANIDRSAVVTVGSTAVFMLSLNDYSKRINVNERFYAGFWGLSWKIKDINYKNGLAYLYCERDTVQSSDDTVNGIADRWTFETSDKYVISIDGDSLNLSAGDTLELSITVTKNGVKMDTLPALEWLNSDASVATVEGNTVKGLKEGSCVLTASYKPNEGDECTPDSVSITVAQDVYTIDITESTVSLNVDDTHQLTATLTKNGTIIDNPNILWATSDSSILSVENGLIRALSSGSATVTASYEGVSDSVSVDIAEAPTGSDYEVLASTTSYTVYNGSSVAIEGLKARMDGFIIVENPACEWTSSDNSIATVENNIIYGHGVGECTLTGVYKPNEGDTCSKPLTLTATVNANKYKVTITASESTVKVGDTLSLNTLVYKNGTKDTTLKAIVTSSDNTIATVADYKVTGVKEGDVTITGTFNDILEGDKVTDGTLAITVESAGETQPFTVTMSGYDASTNIATMEQGKSVGFTITRADGSKVQCKSGANPYKYYSNLSPIYLVANAPYTCIVNTQQLKTTPTESNKITKNGITAHIVMYLFDSVTFEEFSFGINLTPKS